MTNSIGIEMQSNSILIERKWARGVTTTYAYDGWNNLTNTTYSDGTPSVAFAYDALGRRTAIARSGSLD